MIKELTFSPVAFEVYENLKRMAQASKVEKSIFTAIQQKILIIKGDPDHGKKIKPHKIPIEYRVRYEAKNLFKIKLPSFWRMLYTIVWSEAEKGFFVHILDIMDHRQYDRKFKKR